MIREQYSRVKRERENRAFALSQRPRALLFAPVVSSSSLKVSFFVGKIFIIIFVSFIVSLLLSSHHPPPQGKEKEINRRSVSFFVPII